jgi:rhodanese-related sulfurtransferase
MAIMRWIAIAAVALASCQSANRDANEPDGTLEVAGELPGDELPADVGAEEAQEEADVGPWPDGRYISPEEVHARLGAGDPDMLPLNVSDEEFWSMGHIEGSVIVPWDLLEGRLDEVDPSRHVVVYCRRGVRSESGYDTLAAAGYAHMWVMSGGLEAWIALGYPVVP